MRILVTGASGFVGRHLAPRLRRDAHDLIETDQELDVGDPGVVSSAVDRIRPDAIVHLAAQSSVVASLRDPVGTHRINYLGTLAVLRGASFVSPSRWSGISRAG